MGKVLDKRLVERMRETTMIRPISSEATRSLRQQLLRPSQTLDQLAYEGDELVDALHLGAFEGDIHIAIASAFRQSPPDEEIDGAWRLRGVAVSPDHRSRGLGALLVDQCVDHAIKHAGKIMWCTARTSASKFYLRIGWSIKGPPFELQQFGPHYLMCKNLIRQAAEPAPTP